MPNPINEVNKGLYCPSCGHQGMRLLNKDRAVSGRKRYRCQGCGSRTTQPSFAPVQILPRTRVSEIKKHKFFVITSAVCNTPLVNDAFETFKQIANANDGMLLVIPTVYKNPDLKHKDSLQGVWYPDEIIPYLCNANVKLNNNLVIKGETRIEHTVINPLQGMNHAGSHESEIYGHGQLAMEMVANSKEKLPKMLHTTGSISKPNYGGSQRAQKAKFHHSISAVIIEIEGDTFWPRQVMFDGEGAYDLNRYYTPNGFNEGWTTAGIVFGDTHVRALTAKTESLLRKVSSALDPEYQVLHDVHDHHVGSHHTEKDVIQSLRHSMRKEYSVRDELMMAVKFLERQGFNIYIVDSNHNRHLDQWFNRFNPSKDVVNLELYYELAEMLQSDLKAGGDGDLFRLFVSRHCKVDVNFVDCNKQFLIRSIDCSQHGDRGPNGTRGSAKSFAKSGSKTFIGHSHTPRIEKGCWQTGTSSEDMSYANGFSSWMNTHGLIYDNGKRALFNIVKGKLSPSMRKL